MKTFILGPFFSAIIVGPALSQSVLLDDNQSTFFLNGGVAGGEGLTSYNFGFGATFESFVDVEIGFSRVTDGIGSAWGLGEGLGVNIYRDQVGIHTVFLSLTQTLTFIEGGRSVTLGGLCSNQIRFSDDNTLAFSFGASWLQPLNPGSSSILVFPLQIAFSVKGDDSRFYLAPGVTIGSNNSAVYGLTAGLSFNHRTRNFNDRW